MRQVWHWLTVSRGHSSPAFCGIARRGNSRRGVALVLVATTLMFMTVLVTEISFGSRVRFLQAAHETDEVAAQGIAETGVNLYQLVLVANKQLAGNQQLADASAMFGVNLGDALWQMLPSINTSLLRMLFVGGGDLDEEEIAESQEHGISEEVREESRETSRFEDRNFLDFEGDFIAEITDEDSRVNVGRLASFDSVPLTENPAAIQLFGLMSGDENDQFFYDRNLDRWELIANLLDWIDTDNMRSGTRGGYEDDLYNRLDSPYLAKNADFDSKEEIRLVEGWQDEVFDRLADQITIYGDGKININTASREVITGLLKAYVTPSPTDYQCELLLQEFYEYKLLANFSQADEFVNWLKGQGVTVSDGLKAVIGTSSNVFTITSTGLVGESTRMITAVLDFSNSAQGQVVYWRVD